MHDSIKENLNISPSSPTKLQPQRMTLSELYDTKHHEHISPPEADHGKEEKLCIHHKRKFAIYCESCEEPICEQCSILGPHNNQLHRINTFPESYKARIMALFQLIGEGLIPKRDQLIAQIHRLDYRLEEVKNIKTVIDRDIRIEFAGIIERLRSAEGTKLATLQHDIAHLQKDIDKISDIIQLYDELTKEDAQPIEFLCKYRSLTEMIEFTLAMSFKTEIDINADNLPKELTDRRSELEKSLVVQQVLTMKDQVIFSLIEKKRAAQATMISNINQGTKVEIDEWSKLTDKFSAELKKYHKICFYCACTLDDVNINTACNLNNRTQIPVETGFTKAQPERRWHGTRRHYFDFPNAELIKGGKIYFEGKSHEDKVFRMQYRMFLVVLLSKVRKYCLEKGIKVDKIFTDHDKDKKGYISHIAFTYLLKERCNVDLAEIEKLKTILDPENTNKIVYEKFISLVNNPKSLQDE